MSFEINKIYTYKQKNELWTPVNAVTPLIKYLPEDAVVWECAEKPTHDGNITLELLKNNISVIATSIHTGTDFLTCGIPDNVTHIITNPPFEYKNEFLKRCYEIGKPFALLLPIQALGTKTRFEMYSKYGLQLIMFDKRISYIGSNGSPPFASAWFTNGILSKDLVWERVV